MDMLPEDCVAKVLSLTSPKDACRLSLVGTTFRWAAESDAVWDKFLPSDYKDIISRAITAPPLPAAAGEDPLPHPKSKKHLYFSFSDHPLIIDHGTKSFSLEKRTGKRCYMLAARDLTISMDGPYIWRWTSLPESRFGEVAGLMSAYQHEIEGKINVSLLSPNTTYTAFLVFKSTETAYSLKYKPAKVSIGIRGGETKIRMAYWDPDRMQSLQRQIVLPPPSFFNCLDFYDSGLYGYHLRVPRGIEEDDDDGVELAEGLYTKVREDGWMEIELGDYYNGNGDDVEEIEDDKRELEMSLSGHNWQYELIVQGIEIRPKVAD